MSLKHVKYAIPLFIYLCAHLNLTRLTSTYDVRLKQLHFSTTMKTVAGNTLNLLPHTLFSLHSVSCKIGLYTPTAVHFIYLQSPSFCTFRLKSTGAFPDTESPKLV